MHLIAPLAGGIIGAGNGSVNLVLRGTSTPANYYADFEATQLLPGTAVPLDSNGRLIAYVASLVTVSVHDVNGVDVCSFVAGDEDAAVEVISPSFTGVDYTSGASGTQKPTNLENILDAWLTSAGAPDWKVLFNGSPANIQAAFAATFFNVRTYGATGNGTSDDRSAIVAAQAAATAAGGGIVYFPQGIYRVTANVSIAANVTWLGCGGQSTKFAIDSVTGSGCVALPANGAGATSSVWGMWFGAINGTSPGALVGATAVSTGEFRFFNCTFGIDALCVNPFYVATASVAALKVTLTSCYLKAVAGSSVLINHAGAARLIVRDCDLISAQNLPADMVTCGDGALFEGNRFDASAGTTGPAIHYLVIAPATYGGVAVIGNTFAANASVGSIAIYNTLAVPSFDCLEYGNIFGTPTGTGCTPYGYNTDGYAANVAAQMTSGHGSRYSRQEGIYGQTAATQTVDPKSMGTTVIQKTAGAALTINANKGSAGDKWTLHIINASGGGLTITAGTDIIFDPSVAAGTLAIGTAGFSEQQFQWLPVGSGIGHWYMVGKAITT